MAQQNKNKNYRINAQLIWSTLYISLKKIIELLHFQNYHTKIPKLTTRAIQTLELSVTDV